MKELHSTEEINQFFGEANAFTKIQIYGMAYQQNKKNKKQ